MTDTLPATSSDTYSRYLKRKRMVDLVTRSTNLVDVQLFNEKHWVFIIYKDFKPSEFDAYITTVGKVSDGIEGNDKLYIFKQKTPYYKSPDLRYNLSNLPYTKVFSIILSRLVDFQKLNYGSISRDDLEEFMLSMCTAIYYVNGYDIKEDDFDSLINSSIKKFEFITRGYSFDSPTDLLNYTKEFYKKRWYVPSSENDSTVNVFETKGRDLFNSAVKLIFNNEDKLNRDKVIDIMFALLDAHMFVSKETIQEHLDNEIGVNKLRGYIHPYKDMIRINNKKYFGCNTYKKYNTELQNK